MAAVSLLGGLTLLWLVLAGFAGVCCLGFAAIPTILLFSLGHFVFRSNVLKQSALLFWRFVGDSVSSLWFCSSLFWIELVCGTKYIVLTKDGKVPNLPETKATLLISNHRTRLDWMYLWGVVLRLGQLRLLKIILKSSLKKIPLFGDAMQCFRFIFLNRNWTQDEKTMYSMLRANVQQQYPALLLLFPEGTDLSDENVELSHKFSDEHGLVRYNFVLHPRSKGFIAAVDMLRGGEEEEKEKEEKKKTKKGSSESFFGGVLDVTMGYEGVIPVSEKHILQASHPKVVHVILNHFLPNELPKDNEGLEKWVKSRFAEKEQSLAVFTSNNNNNNNNSNSNISPFLSQNGKATTPAHLASLKPLDFGANPILRIVAANVLWVIVLVALFSNLRWWIPFVLVIGMHVASRLSGVGLELVETEAVLSSFTDGETKGSN